MADFKLSVAPRTEKGKNANHRLRATGFVPGVVYGSDIDSLLVQVEEREIANLLEHAGTSHLVDLQIEGREGPTPVLIKEVQTDPVKGDLLHIDFHQVPLNKPIATSVPVYLVGEEERESDGGVLTFSLREVEISCLPTQIPEAIEVDVSGLTIGDNIHVGDLQAPEGTEILTAADEIVVSVTLPTREVEEEPAEEALEGEEEVVPGEEEEGARAKPSDEGDADEDEE